MVVFVGILSGRSDNGSNRSDKGGYCQGRYVMMWGCGVDNFHVM